MTLYYVIGALVIVWLLMAGRIVFGPNIRNWRKRRRLGGTIL